MQWLPGALKAIAGCGADAETEYWLSSHTHAWGVNGLIVLYISVF
jgi:hypothetical protein